MRSPATWLLWLALGALAAAPNAPWVPDQGDGTYRNPVLYADYSDPDAIRVGDDFYLTASSFNAVPGLPVLHSKDLVNWRLVGHALPRLAPEEAFRVPQHGNGVWAPCLRFHGGRFLIYYGDPDHGIFVVSARDPAGPWTRPVLVEPGRGLIDPTPLFDDDGRAWLLHAWAKSRAGFNNVLTLHELSPDGSRVRDAGRVLIDGNRLPGYRTLEGPKLYKRHGWYWVFAPAGGVSEGWQSAFRSRSLQGPYEDRVVLAQGTTPVNGPHQGALVDTQGDGSWFLHFQDRGPYGRIVHLQPVAWRQGWPVIGSDPDGDGTGEPVPAFRKPDVGATPASSVPATSDDFAAPRLGLQWQWQANPRPEWSSLAERPGALRLRAQAPAAAGSLHSQPSLLLQKLPAPALSATVRLSFAPAATGERAGLIVFGDSYAWIGAEKTDDGLRVAQWLAIDARAGGSEGLVASAPLRSGRLSLRVEVSDGARCRFGYSEDGRRFEPLGNVFQATPGRWVGAKLGLVAVAAPGAEAAGHADFEDFAVEPLGEVRTTGAAPPAVTPGWVKTVALDGSGDYTSVQEAIAAAPTGTAERPSLIHVKPGTYRELLYVQREKRFLRLIGEDPHTTVITHDLHAKQIGLDGKPIGTFRTATAVIDADDFSASGLTFENAAGPVGQALAVRLDGDRLVFRRCRFLGWQDTILANRGRHYFEDSEITGHVDFIFGAATAWFERCRIRCLGNGYVTAASTPPEQPFGFVFNLCRISGESPEVRTYLGRPWRDHAAVVFLGCEMTKVVRPEGWHNWDRPERELTARYAEYDSRGAGGLAPARVPWARHVSPDEAAQITADRVLGDASHPAWWRAHR